MKTFRQHADAFPGTRSGFCWGFVLGLRESLLRVAQWRVCASGALVGPSPRLLCSDSPRRALRSWKMKSVSLKMLVRLEEKLCEFCIFTKKEKVGHMQSLFCLKETEKRMKKKMSDNSVLSQLLKPTWFVSEAQDLTPAPYPGVSCRFEGSLPRCAQ